MLRMTQSTSAAAAHSYFTEGLAQEDYYTRDQVIGRFAGKGAERLGLQEAVTPEAFAALCSNRNPVTGDRLTCRTRADRTVGYDLTFNAPKSVSLAWALTGDERIMTAFQKAVRETMQELESEAKTRVRKGGQDGDRTTGNLVWAEFIHHTARPVHGVCDPHLHCHAYTFNMTWDGAETAWKALQARDLKRDCPYWEAAFHARLAHGMTELGYGIKRDAKYWEIAGIPRTLIEKFSNRTALIEEVATAKEVIDPEEKAKLGAKTRERKQGGHSWGQLRSLWDARLTPADREVLREAARGHRPGPARQEAGPRAAMDYALLHSYERQSVVSEKQLLTSALKRGVGLATPEAVKAELARSHVITREREGQKLVTTQAVLAQEEALLGFARRGRGACQPLGRPGYSLPVARLNDQQRAAVRHLLELSDQVMLLRGAAGTGKTTLLRSAKQAIEAGGKSVFAFAPTAEASRGVLRQDGFAEADTVARLIQDEKLQARIEGQVILIDEAGLVGTRDLKRVFDLAEAKGARVILSGDYRQHSSVPRGDAFRLLHEYGGLPIAEVHTVQRQRGEYRSAVESLGRGDVAGGFERLDRLGCVREIDNDRARQLAADYLESVAQGKRALVVSPTHREIRRVTRAIREGLRERGLLGSEERTIRTQTSMGLTEAQRQDPVHYRAGLVVQFVQNVKGGFRRGDRVTVAGHDAAGNVLVHRDGGAAAVLPLAEAKHFDLYEAGEMRLAAGDRIRITMNGYTADKKRLSNGSLHEVKGFTEGGDILLKGGGVLPQSFGHVAQGFAVTSHASQGKTVDRVILAAGSESFPAVSARQFYVSVSRAREHVTIYTDDKAGLLDAARRSGDRMSAHELTRPLGAPGEDGRSRLRRHAELVQRRDAEARRNPNIHRPEMQPDTRVMTPKR